LVTKQLAELADALEEDRSRLERELAEIDLLMRQAASEVERHEQRRTQAVERLAALETADSDRETLSEAHAQVLSQTRRQTMMQGQIEVLEGKQRALQRYQQRLEQIRPVLAEANEAPRQLGTGNGAEGAAAGNGAGASSREVMAAQEAMRREIARQMHDGPAQSIANIALQAQVVQRLFSRDPRQTEAELGQLVAMVQNALEQTKNFIFDVRPMVLDDLGLVPTLRRAAAERSRRTGKHVVFESVGADGRLATELESGLFRIVDDALQAMIETGPSGLIVRLDWLENGVKATVRGKPSGQPDVVDTDKAAVAAARRDRQMTAAHASMIHEQERTAARGINDNAWAEIKDRAEPVGIEVSLSSDGWTVEAKVARRR
jgi:two-component system sensor histidine kinase DegS